MKKRVLATVMTAVLAVGALAGCEGGSKDKAKVTAKVLEYDLTEEEYAFAIDQSQPELLESVNEYIAQIKSDGTFDAICEKYFGNGTPTPVVSAQEDASKDQLLVATNAAFAPFEYMEGDNYYGVDMEIAAGLANYLGKELVIQNMDFDAVLLSVNQGKSDMSMSGLTVTDERKEIVNFTTSYYTASQRLIIRSDNTERRVTERNPGGTEATAAVKTAVSARQSFRVNWKSPTLWLTGWAAGAGLSLILYAVTYLRFTGRIRRGFRAEFSRFILESP